jgi:recombination protein RecT
MAGPNQQIQTKPATLADLIASKRQDFLQVIPKHLNPDRLIRLAQSCVNRSTSLATCTPASVLVGVMQAATLGLELDVLGEAYLIPFKGQAVMVPGYKGLVKLAHRGGVVAGFQVGTVRDGDEFDFALGSEPFVKHRPSLAHDAESKEAIAYYSVAKLKSGFAQITVMSRAQVEAAKRASPGAKRSDSPWNTHFDEMAMKTCVRRGAKMLPLTPELSKVLDYEDRRDREQPITDLFPEIEAAMALDAEGRTLPPAQQGTAQTVAGKLGVQPIGPDDPNYIPFGDGPKDAKREPGEEG